MRLTNVALATAAIAFPLAAFGGLQIQTDRLLEVHEQSKAAPASLPRVNVHSAELFPHETPTDWVSYADQVVIATVIGDRELAPEGILIEHGEGYLGRSVRLRIEETLWSANREEAPNEVEVKALGWIVHADQRAFAHVDDAPRIVVGGRYVVPLVKYSREWGPLSLRAVVPARGSAVAQADADDNGFTSLSRQFRNATSTVIAGALATAPRDPKVEAARSLAPEDRVRAVVRFEGTRRSPDLNDPILAQILKTRTLRSVVPRE